MGEISESLGYPQWRTSAVVRSLVKIGYLKYDTRARTYVPTPELLENMVNTDPFRRALLRPMLQEVNRRTGHNAFLATRNGLFAQSIYVVRATSPGRPHITLGALQPLAGSGTGHVILGMYPDAEVRKIVARINSEAPSREQVIKIPDLLRDIAEVRARGYALSLDQVRQRGGMLVMPLPGSSAVQPLVLGIAGISEVLSTQCDALTAIMREEINRHLANAPPKLINPATTR